MLRELATSYHKQAPSPTQRTHTSGVLLLLGAAQQAMLAGDVAQDDVRLHNVVLPVNQPVVVESTTSQWAEPLHDNISSHHSPLLHCKQVEGARSAQGLVHLCHDSVDPQHSNMDSNISL